MNAWEQPDAFAWVDDYLAHVRPHFEVRTEDALLIANRHQADAIKKLSDKLPPGLL